MNFSETIAERLKQAMREKNTIALETLRAIKSAILLEQTQAGANKEFSEEQKIKLLNRLAKQRKEAAEIYRTQNRPDLAEVEIAQLAVIESFLPQALTATELEQAIREIATSHGLKESKEFGTLMGLASKTLAGRADGKAIAAIAKSILSQG